MTDICVQCTLHFCEKDRITIGHYAIDTKLACTAPEVYFLPQSMMVSLSIFFNNTQ